MVVNGVGLGFLQKAGGVALSLYLVRIIDKEAYGAFGVASAVVMLLMTASVERFAESSFHVKDGEDPRFDRHLGFALLLHGLLFAAIFGAGLLALGSERYAPAAPLLFFGSLSPLLNAPRIIYSVDLSRRLDWRKIRLLGLAAFATATVGSLGFAWAGHGGLALMSQVVLTPLPYLAHMAVARRDLWRVSFDLRGYGSALRFGLYRAGGSAVAHGRETVENLAVSAGAGLAALGVYGRAFGLAQLTCGWLAMQLATIVYPVLSKVEARTADHRRASGLLLRLCLWTAAPAAVAVGAAHVDAISVIYGARWAEAAPFVRPLLIVAVATTVTAGLNVVALTSVGARFVFFNQLVAASLAGLGLALALPISIVAYAWSLAVAMSAQSAFVAGRLIAARALDPVDVGRALAPPAVLAALAFAAMSGAAAVGLGVPAAPEAPPETFLAALALRLAEAPAWARLVAASATAAAVAGVLIRALDAPGLSDALKFAPGRLQGVARAVLLLPAALVRPVAAV